MRMEASREIGATPPLRLGVLNDRPPNADGTFVLYWMIAARRMRWNFALQRAIGWAQTLKRPLVIVEVLTCGGRWDSHRHHTFVLQGMADNARQTADTAALYYPYVERQPGDCAGFFAALSEQACVVVTDAYPIALPAMAAVDAHAPVRVEKVDGNGLLPLQAADRAFPTAFGFRRFLQRTLCEHLLDAPQPNPFARVRLPSLQSLPATIAHRWPPASPQLLSAQTAALASLPIDDAVPATAIVGGPRAAGLRWKTFAATRLAFYCEGRNQPEADGTSGLAPYLHFGHIAPHEIFYDLARLEDWSPANLPLEATGSREGWWGMSESAEAFLDQCITWREVGFNGCAHRTDYAAYGSLPPWAQATLAKHAADPRPHVYSQDEFAKARTHDPLWNAAQRQLVVEGTIHNYLRMLWGKKILEWTASPQEALEVMVELNHRYALDGQDPNSYAGIFWILGRYDRAWGPERPVFGTVRYMSSENTARKVRVRQYLQRYAAEPSR